MQNLADSNHPLVQNVARQLTANATGTTEKVASIFKFVRDDILFGFPPEGDFVKASETITRGYGQCNTKGTLFLALCKSIDIPTRIHFSRISKEIQHGFFTGLFYKLMPNNLTHSWVEVEIDGQWYPLDSYINDLKLHHASARELNRRGWQTGFSISCKAGPPSAEFVLDDQHYAQMAVVVGDQGTWDEPAEFYNGSDYLNRQGFIKRLLYRLYLPIANRRIQKLRESVHHSISTEDG